MDKYPSDRTQTTGEHKSKHGASTLIKVVIGLVIVVGALVVIALLHRPITGTVTAVNATSITIRPSADSTTKTFSVTSATLMGLPKPAGDNNVQPLQFNANDIHIGETVAINVGANNQAQAVSLIP